MSDDPAELKKRAEKREKQRLATKKCRAKQKIEQRTQALPTQDNSNQDPLHDAFRLLDEQEVHCMKEKMVSKSPPTQMAPRQICPIFYCASNALVVAPRGPPRHALPIHSETPSTPPLAAAARANSTDISPVYEWKLRANPGSIPRFMWAAGHGLCLRCRAGAVKR